MQEATSDNSASGLSSAQYLQFQKLYQQHNQQHQGNLVLKGGIATATTYRRPPPTTHHHPVPVVTCNSSNRSVKELRHNLPVCENGTPDVSREEVHRSSNSPSSDAAEGVQRSSSSSVHTPTTESCSLGGVTRSSEEESSNTSSSGRTQHLSGNSIATPLTVDSSATTTVSTTPTGPSPPPPGGYTKASLCEFALEGLNNYLARQRQGDDGGESQGAVVTMVGVSYPGSSSDGNGLLQAISTTSCARDIIDRLKAEKLDSKVKSTLEDLSRPLMVEVIRMLCFSPAIVMELCLTQRGKVVTHVIATMRGEGCECLVDVLTDNLRELATHRVGCVALSRSYDALMTYKQSLGHGTAGLKRAQRKSSTHHTQQQPHGASGSGGSGVNGGSGIGTQTVAVGGGSGGGSCWEPAPTRSVLHFIHRVIAVLPELACHPQGNFVCSAILSPGSPKEAFSGLMRCFESNPSLFSSIAMDKSGSHLLDAYSNNCNVKGMKELVRFLRVNPFLITEMGRHNVGNYPLQCLLRNAVGKLQPPAQSTTMQSVAIPHHHGQNMMMLAGGGGSGGILMNPAVSGMLMQASCTNNNGVGVGVASFPPHIPSSQQSFPRQTHFPSAAATAASVVGGPQSPELCWLRDQVPCLCAGSNHLTRITTALGMIRSSTSSRPTPPPPGRRI